MAISCFHAVAGFVPFAIVSTATAMLLATMPSRAHAQYMHEPREALTNNTPIPILQQVGIDQRIGQQLPLDHVFRDETGRSVPLGHYFSGRPVLLALVYYQCPMLCSQVLNGLVSSLLPLKLKVGRDFDVVTVSFDPRDTPAEATQKRDLYLRRYSRAGAEKGWHFLVGDATVIAELTKAVGFRYAWDPKIQQYAHLSGIMIATPDGRLSRYFYGIEYAPKELRLALVESSQGKLGNLVDQVMLYCYHYDPATGKYGAMVMNMLRLGGGLTLLIVGGLLALAWRRELRLKIGRRLAAAEQESTGRAS
jgi:protein SCO1